MPRGGSNTADKYIPPEARWDVDDRWRSKRVDDPKEWREPPGSWSSDRYNERREDEHGRRGARDVVARGGDTGGSGVEPGRLFARDGIEGGSESRRADADSAQHRFARQDRSAMGDLPHDARSYSASQRGLHTDLQDTGNGNWRGNGAPWKADDAHRLRGIDRGGVRGDGQVSRPSTTRHADTNRMDGSWTGETRSFGPRDGSGPGNDSRRGFGGRSLPGGGGGRDFHVDRSSHRLDEVNGRSSGRGGTVPGGVDGDGQHGWIGRKRPLNTFNDGKGDNRGGPRKVTQILICMYDS